MTIYRCGDAKTTLVDTIVTILRLAEPYYDHSQNLFNEISKWGRGSSL